MRRRVSWKTWWLLVASILVIILLIATNFLISHWQQSYTQPASSTRIIAPHAHSDIQRSSHGVEAKDPSVLCVRFAPRVLKVYTTDTPNRAALISQYYTRNANGLSLPVARIARQPLDEYTGFLMTSSRGSVTCSVGTGLEAPWILQFSKQSDGRWLCSSVAGPWKGAYKILGDKLPDRDQERQ